MCLEQYGSAQVKCRSVWSYAPRFYLAPAGKHHDQQYEWLKIDTAAEDGESAASEEEEVNTILWKGLVLLLQHKLYVETHIFKYKQGGYM